MRTRGIIMKLFFTILLSIFSSFSFSADQIQTINLVVTEKGFEPSIINVKKGTNVVLKVTRKTNSTCATQIDIPSKKISMELPLNEPVIVKLGKVEQGEIKFGCGMDMVTGVVFVK